MIEIAHTIKWQWSLQINKVQLAPGSSFCFFATQLYVSQKAIFRAKTHTVKQRLSSFHIFTPVLPEGFWDWELIVICFIESLWKNSSKQNNSRAMGARCVAQNPQWYVQGCLLLLNLRKALIAKPVIWFEHVTCKFEAAHMTSLT